MSSVIEPRQIGLSVARFGLAVSLFLAVFTWPEVTRAADVIEFPPLLQGLGYHIVKNWDFSSTISTKEELEKEFYYRYVYDGGQLDHFHDEWERYRDAGNHDVHDGALHLVARLHGKLASGNIESGMIRSKWVGKYGYFEANVKLPVGRGMWPAFWLNPQDQVWPPEIDIVETVDNGRDTPNCSFHALHSSNNEEVLTLFSRLNKAGYYCHGSEFSESFHRFAVWWTPGLVRHYVDGELIATRSFVWQHSNGVDGGNAHVLLNLAVGGGWAGPPLTAAEFPADFQVRWIRVWQQ